MAKKKVRTTRRAVIGSSGNKNDPVELKVDLDGIIDIDNEEVEDSEQTIKVLTISPAGYPLQIKDSPDLSDIKIEDNNLFQAYAADEWAGLSVSEDEFLFDQMILPDFAFRITKIEPKNAHKITYETEFELLTPKKKKSKLEKVIYKEIIGNKQAIKKCKIIGEYIKNPKIFGKWAPKNVLFYGPPGTGKTLTAKALAYESKVPIFNKKGTSLIGLHVGDGASKIHHLYEEARLNAPSIIFIDEIDAVGLNRSYQSVRGDVVELITALLSEMDGLDRNEGVITIAATNSIDLLDYGLRSRFEEEIEFPLPSFEERVDLLKLFLKMVNITVDVDYNRVASETDKWSGRDIKEKLVKSALYETILEKSEKITTDQLLKIVKRTLKDQREPNSMFN